MCEVVTAFLAANSAAISTAGTAVSMLGSYQQSQGAKAAANYSAAVSANNAKVADWQARDAEDRADRNAQEVGRRQAALRGTQAAALAANGVDISTGSAGAILDQTDFYGTQDQKTAQENGSREAWALRTKRDNFNTDAQWSRARASAESPWMAAGSSLLAGAGNVADKWAAKRSKG